MGKVSKVPKRERGDFVAEAFAKIQAESNGDWTFSSSSKNGQNVFIGTKGGVVAVDRGGNVFVGNAKDGILGPDFQSVDTSKMTPVTNDCHRPPPDTSKGEPDDDPIEPLGVSRSSGLHAPSSTSRNQADWMSGWKGFGDDNPTSYGQNVWKEGN
jgi:hypothetical protein